MITKELLEEEYSIKEKTVAEIANMFGVTRKYITNLLKEFQIPILNNGKRTCKNLLGQEFGNLVVIKRGKLNKNGAVWICECICGQELSVLGTTLRQGYKKSCGNKSCKTNAKLVGNLYRATFTDIKLNAMKRNIQFDITIEDAWNKFIEQDGRCALTGEQLYLPEKTTQNAKVKSNASLDRIDSSKSYQKDNIQWTTKNINLMKRSLSNKEFIELCRKVTQYKENHTYESCYTRRESYARPRTKNN